ncbi:glycosyltransferase family protein [Tellurirhabdus bombi]|uniref:glycosyltransferase family protein n=1 Tax=Tellurirhabdus bombi TaxID=2907205 RepID=UPI001F24B87E|nr:glycosyltransferase family protein [Tellurirhabdus bombi]
MRILFLVQGEGRGHLTQALALCQLVETAGHTVVGAMVGVAENRPVPQFFAEKFNAPVIPFTSPALVYNSVTNALDPVKTLFRGLSQSPALWKSMRAIRDEIEKQQPEVVINFYELLGGLTYAYYRPAAPMICIAHQYLSFHPVFLFPAGKRWHRWLFRLNSQLTAWGAHELLALSFDRQLNVPRRRLRVVPPLLRQEVLDLKPVSGDYVLTYVSQSALVTQLVKAHHQRPDVSLRCFHADAKAVAEKVDDTLKYHAISSTHFLKAMQGARAVITTAGFEAVCEALYLGKPVLMIPQPNHFEQACNALDGQRIGAGIAANSFDISRLIDFLPQYDPVGSERFKQWHAQGYYLFLGALNRAKEAKNDQSSHTPWSFMGKFLRLSK